MKRISTLVATGGLFAGLAVGPTALASGAQPPEAITTTLPSHVEVGATGSVDVAYSVSTLYPASAVTVQLVDRSRVVAQQTIRSASSMHFSGRLVLEASTLEGSGSFDWEVAAAFAMHNGVIQERTSIRRHSLLGLAARRAGHAVRIHGVARRLAPNGKSWVAWPKEPVAVQRWTAEGWRTVRHLRTDRRGEIDVTLGIPSRVGLRLVSSSTSDIWGETTKSSVS